MAIDSVPLDGPDSRRSRRSCLAPLTVFTGALAIALVGSGLPDGVLRSSSMRMAMTGQRILSEAANQPFLAPESTEASAPEMSHAEPQANETASTDADRQIADEPPAHWAWLQLGPLSPLPDPALPLAGGTAEAPRTAMTVPLPVPRPPEFRGPGATALARRAERRMARRDLPPAQPTAQPVDERSFLEKLFGIERSPALAYTALESKPVDVVPQRRISPPLALSREPSAVAGVAVYNIASRTVTLPSGERLEAHSGLGEGLDEPRLVNVRMRGPTPPGTYDLTEREQLFHGVRAIRLTPVGGSDAVYGRVGLLAHTFMLGPRGDSNGCVSFRDYERFLQAFLRGEVQRLVVVTGTQDPLPAMADGGRTRMARNGG
ncbi:DUF2778 domain-containing protein [Methylobacterium sp. E-005]|uniref:DUF2778 domain-containing protein n=1 Tax=Methylobacterium sp. E-005 TaxID=2836549 RepID=UPI001FB97F74|nr:DUF2778 domain-containing protein [Methylobacterium sp. E-005]MCJ2085637.1 DUF2778 domain-containing protein [Methylobacterium sp. E-005]